MTEPKEYLGDAVYAELSGDPARSYWEIILTTENGIAATNTIVLEPQVVGALVAFLKQREIL